jgi:hypothetical protein
VFQIIILNLLINLLKNGFRNQEIVWRGKGETKKAAWFCKKESNRGLWEENVSAASFSHNFKG